MDYETKANGESRTGIPIIRITWSDGKWWDVLEKMPQKVDSQVRIAMASVAKVTVKGGSLESETDESKGATSWAEAAEQVRMVRVKGCTVAWSWELPVSEDVIGDHDPDRVKDVLDVMNRLHRPDTEVMDKEEKKGSASQSSTASLSGVNGSARSNT